MNTVTKAEREKIQERADMVNSFFNIDDVVTDLMQTFGISKDRAFAHAAKAKRKSNRPQPPKTARVEIRVTPADKAKLAEIKRLSGKTPADLLGDAMAMVECGMKEAHKTEPVIYELNGVKFAQIGDYKSAITPDCKRCYCGQNFDTCTKYDIKDALKCQAEAPAEWNGLCAYQGDAE